MEDPVALAVDLSAENGVGRADVAPRFPGGFELIGDPCVEPLPDEKAALILFIDRKDASASIEAADSAMRNHAAFKRVGEMAQDGAQRRNYMLGHPDDQDREIHVAMLFAVLPKEGGSPKKRAATSRVKPKKN